MINNYYINNIDISFLKDSYFEYIFIYFIFKPLGEAPNLNITIYI